MRISSLASQHGKAHHYAQRSQTHLQSVSFNSYVLHLPRRQYAQQADLVSARHTAFRIIVHTHFQTLLLLRCHRLSASWPTPAAQCCSSTPQTWQRTAFVPPPGSDPRPPSSSTLPTSSCPVRVVSQLAIQCLATQIDHALQYDGTQDVLRSWGREEREKSSGRSYRKVEHARLGLVVLKALGNLGKGVQLFYLSAIIMENRHASRRDTGVCRTRTSS